MKKLTAFALCLLCLLLFTGMALAERTFAPIPESQLKLLVPQGLDYTKTCENGHLSIAINDEDSNWALAASNGIHAELVWQVKVPEGISTPTGLYLYMDFDGQGLAAANEVFDKAENENRHAPIFNVNNGIPEGPEQNNMPNRALILGRPISEAGLFDPQNNDFTLYLGWYDGETPVLYQQLRISNQHSKTAAFQTALGTPVPKERIIASDAANVLNIADGRATYWGAQAGDTVITGVKAPESAIYFKLSAGLMDESAADEPVALPDDRVLDVEIILSGNGPDNHSSAHCFQFFDSQKKPIATETLTIGFQQEQTLLPWPAYYDLEPVWCYDAEDDCGGLVIENGAAEAGYTLTYDEATGHITCRFDQHDQPFTGLRSGEAPGKVTLKLIAPPWAVGYQLCTAGSNSLMGAGGGNPDRLEDAFPEDFTPITPGEAITLSYDPFVKIQPADASLTLYVPDASANVPYYTDLILVRWIDEEGSIDFPTYLWRTTESFAVAEKKVPAVQKKDLDTLDKTVKQPTVVTPNGKPYEGAQLLIRAYYTASSGEWLYDLTMLDANGNLLKPGNNGNSVWVYLPLPEGHTSGQRYKLNHYRDALYNGSNLSPQETLEVQETIYGLMFETTSFSPFLLSKAEAEQPVPPSGSQEGNAATATPVPTVPAQPPKSGDDTPVVFLVLMAAFALAGVGFLMKRKVRS